MQFVKKKRVTREVVEDIICNKCGESLKVDEDGVDTDFYGLIGIEVQGSYYSPVFGGGDMYEFDLCEACLKKFFKTFKISSKLEGSFF